MRCGDFRLRSGTADKPVGSLRLWDRSARLGNHPSPESTAKAGLPAGVSRGERERPAYAPLRRGFRLRSGTADKPADSLRLSGSLDEAGQGSFA
jgi:hypothetical protein